MKTAGATRRKNIFPGFGISLGITMAYLGIIVLIPLTMVFMKTASMGFLDFWQAVAEPRVLASIRLTVMTALAAALVNAVFGLLIAWVLTRYTFPGKKLLDGLVDLPFALPTAVAGIALTSLYSPNGWIGQFLHIKVAFTPLGIIIALVFIGLPFIVRTVQPVIENIEKEIEEASAILGAAPRQTFWKVIFPQLLPSVITGFSLAFARSLGEYGSVVFIAGNIPYKTEIAPLIIMTKLEQYDYSGATAVACVMLMISFLLLLMINLFQWRVSKRWVRS
ncbi:sulfate ABC transporter permease subunit CysT [Bacillus glycinifermentans]|uniref:Sulfate transport system permease protein CysT n=2 Tax=Bacillaceae TaxID=186817 RepID=A0AAJ4D4S2_9BACI|nr:sulfate ABC transporter permease [Bacillus sp. TH008]MBU8787258.1 sulfate ABC transporter permease subunit CysT [Bacillus glycinifermentans]NUJ17301.1 sulfate ABC transporter permease subunit CysT [Bacillus glycinifermentans]QAT67813.1 sulfate ABC transporter permease subunit CysT [Bacillus glycinifermentans]